MQSSHSGSNKKSLPSASKPSSWNRSSQCPRPMPWSQSPTVDIARIYGQGTKSGSLPKHVVSKRFTTTSVAYNKKNDMEEKRGQTYRVRRISISSGTSQFLQRSRHARNGRGGCFVPYQRLYDLDPVSHLFDAYHCERRSVVAFLFLENKHIPISLSFSSCRYQGNIPRRLFQRGLYRNIRQ